jgi:hypothetical protein
MAKKDGTKKITYSAVCVALSAVVVLLSHYTALIVPLVIASLCAYIAFSRCGWLYGVVTVVATTALAFFVCGITVTFIFLVALFLPYAIVAHLMRKLSYKITWQAIVRIVVSVIYFVTFFVLIMLLTDFITGSAITAVIGKIGLPFTAVIVAVATLPVDLFFTFTAEKIMKLMK